MQIDPKEFGGHITEVMDAVKPVGGVDRELSLLPQHLMELSEATMPQECKAV